MYEGQIYTMEEIEFLHEEELMGSQEVQLIEIFKISLHAIVGSMIPRTMRVKSQVHGRTLVILVDKEVLVTF